MKSAFRLLAAAVILAGAASCASMEKMQKMAENVKVSSDPVVLEAVGGVINATVSVTYPKDYFNPKAVVEVTPVIVYDGGEAKMNPLYYQGEKVRGNYKVVSSKGQTVKDNVRFEYVEGMEHSYLELRGKVIGKSKDIDLPSKKVADGVNTTYMLVKDQGLLTYKQDEYKEVVSVSKEGQILYNVNSSEVRQSELKSQSIKDFQASLNEVGETGGVIVGTEIVAYASPEGDQSLNDKLSDKRGESASKVWNKVVGEGLDPTVRSVGEDWEGFQELVKASNIEDKDLILRVLSMYSDPAVRENEIRNMSEVFTELKDEVLPELRRARFIANVEYQNYTADELVKMVDENMDVLDEEALLRAATLVKDSDKKISLYKKAADKFGSERAKYNLAATYIDAGKLDKAEKALKGLQKDADVENALGVIALRQNEWNDAVKHFRAAGTPEANANLGVINILSGNYDDAIECLKDAPGCCHNIALAYILTDQLDKAEEAIHCKSAKCTYLKAIIAARQGRADDVKKYLDDATSRDPELKARVATDIEFAGYDL